MALSDVALCARALLKIGAQPIQSFYDDLAEAEIALALYQPTRDALLSAYPWRFATTQVTLPRLQDAPLADFSYAFQLPNDFLRALSAGSNGNSNGLIFRIARNTLQTDSETAVLNYIFRPAEGDLPPFFEYILIARLAAEFCLPLTESSSRAEVLLRIADREFDKAKRLDAYQDTPKALLDFNLIDARGA
jgi:hypothetical protein